MSKSGKAKRKGKRGRGSKKGSSFEREMCRTLSLWWTNGKDDDVFWRTAGSGARATVRSKRGAKTHGSYGDIGVVNPIGSPLLDVAVFSLKNGYHRTHASGLLDKPNKAKAYELEKWFKEVQDCWEQAGSFAWLLVHRRKARATVVYMPSLLMDVLLRYSEKDANFTPSLHMATYKGPTYSVMRLEDFLKLDPKVFETISQCC